ncbi:hypothetical protein B0J13DRAFT_528640 [Dactylonectria estremocensis]|uniref:Uncharacterized protein n=1 Tax=Dactylonectria estremocensis TaxID=1079267 RepID=A0A9P9IV03_9HYPO|nr:hypothetical protein B0J13DRAFT_528640 [Dactylonectria estremocensis]
MLCGSRLTSGTWDIRVTGLDAIGLPSAGTITIQAYQFNYVNGRFGNVAAPLNQGTYPHTYTGNELVFYEVLGVHFGKHRLYVWVVHPQSSGIKFFYTPLESDGLIKPCNESRKPLGVGSIKSQVLTETSANLNLVRTGDRLLVFWNGASCLTSSKGLFHFGYSTTINQDASVLDKIGWTDIKFEYERQLPTSDNTYNRSFLTVIVPSHYI